MANPVNPTRSVLPSINDPVIDPNTGTMTEEWYSWALAMLNRTGGVSGVSNSDASSTANVALQLAETASTNASTALSLANTANASLSTALTEASGAQAAANTAESIASAALARSANLSDINNRPFARANLGVDTVPLNYAVSTFTGQSLYIGAVQALSIPANFTCVTYAATPPSSNAVITFKVIRTGSGLVQTIGTITMTAGAYSANTVLASAYTINSGDTLQLQLPTSDAANVGITIKALLF